MRILRVRCGFQADHSSSSYLFYAVDHEVSKKGQEVAHRYSSRAEVDEHTARYLKWGESELNYQAFEALLDDHYDVMAEESYGWWTLMMAVPKTAEMKVILAPFKDARGDNDQGVEVVEYPKRMAVTVYCQFQGDGVNLLDDYEGDTLEELVDLLAKIRAELIEGDTSFLAAVADFYGALDGDEEGDEEEESSVESLDTSFENRNKAELQRECEQRGITFRKSWTKAQLQEALAKSRTRRARPRPKKGARPKLSRAAQTIVGELESQ
jgi:hypothetical protein